MNIQNRNLQTADVARVIAAALKSNADEKGQIESLAAKVAQAMARGESEDQILMLSDDVTRERLKSVLQVVHPLWLDEFGE